MNHTRADCFSTPNKKAATYHLQLARFTGTVQLQVARTAYRRVECSWARFEKSSGSTVS